MIDIASFFSENTVFATVKSTTDLKDDQVNSNSICGNLKPPTSTGRIIVDLTNLTDQKALKASRK
jgi:hypothetical protein